MRKWFLLGAILLLVGLMVQAGPIFEAKLAISGAVNNFFSSVLNSREALEEQVKFLEEENRYLKELVGRNPAERDSIKVYSSYPFNSRGEIAIAAGKDKDIRVGDAIVVSGNILVGRVRSVFESSSIVTTIFDPSWEIQVRIGTREVDALMRGGNELKLTLIPRDEYIEEGDIIVVAGQDLPYGLEVGFVGLIETLPGEVFQEAIAEPNVQLNKLRNVALYR